MSNDDRLVPRDYPIPVSVRRPLPAVAINPALQSPPNSVPPASVAPQVIYIHNAPAAIPPVPAPAPPPSVIHHHHYAANHSTHRISYCGPVASSNSALGMASLALGIIACVVCWVPWLGLVAVPVGAIGAILGALGTLVSLLFRKSGVGLPLTAVFICGLAAGISIASTRSIPYWQRQLKTATSAWLPETLPLSHPAAAQPPAVMPTPPPPPVMSQQPAPINRPAIANKPVPPVIYSAIENLHQAELACDERTKQTVEYKAAVRTANQARSRNESLRDTASGSTESILAGQGLINADNTVSQVLEAARNRDPAVANARYTLQQAHIAAGN